MAKEKPDPLLPEQDASPLADVTSMSERLPSPSPERLENARAFNLYGPGMKLDGIRYECLREPRRDGTGWRSAGMPMPPQTEPTFQDRELTPNEWWAVRSDPSLRRRWPASWRKRRADELREFRALVRARKSRLGPKGEHS